MQEIKEVCMKPYLKYAILGMGMCMYLCGLNLGRTNASPLPAVNPAAFVFKDSVTLSIDSVSIIDGSLVFSIMAYRPNNDWQDDGVTNIQDTIMGNLDMYFTLTDAAFDKTAYPTFERLHPCIDNATTSGGKNMLKATTQYWAYRYNIVLKAQYLNSDAGLLSIPLRQWFELCRVRMKMTDATQNPGLEWDKATDGNSSTGEPLVLALQGDAIHNPDSVIRLEDQSSDVVFCEGECTRVWAKGHTSGTHPTFTWFLSDKSGVNIDGYEQVAFYDGPVSGTSPYVKTDIAHTSFGDLNYSIISGMDGLERVDTLEVCPSPGFLDSMFFRCQLSDPSLGVLPKTSQPMKVTLRDSIWGYLASTTSANFGASAKTDTVVKCMDSPSTVSFYFFGRSWRNKAEMKAETGGQLRVYYTYKDASLNVFPSYGQDPFFVTISDLDAQVQDLGLKSPKGTALFETTLSLPDSVSAVHVWVSDIETGLCNNGASYAPYDTIYIREILPDEEVVLALTPRSVSTGETISLDKTRPYNDIVLQMPALGKITKKPGVDTTYTAPTTCNPGDVDTVIYTYAKEGCSLKAKQEIQINDWLYLSAKVYLEGAFIYGTKDLMTFLPYNLWRKDMFGYYKSPSAPDIVLKELPTFDDDIKITDWIQIVLRNESNVGSVFQGVDTTWAFVRQDGVICDTAGNPYVKFKALSGSSYRVVILHRNHLGVMSDKSITLASSAAVASSTVMFDATNINQVYKNPTYSLLPLKTLNNGKLALYAGDVTSDNLVSLADQNTIKRNYQSVENYWLWDINFDGIVTNTDASSVAINCSLNIPVHL